MYFLSFFENLLKKNEVEIDYNKRFEFVKNEVAKENESYKNNKLFEEIAGMSEYCVKPIVSTLNEKFKKLLPDKTEMITIFCTFARYFFNTS